MVLMFFSVMGSAFEVVRAQDNLVFRSTSQVPPTCLGVNLSYDELRREGVLFGGSEASGQQALVFDETWTWASSSWRRHQPQSVPPGRSFAAMAWDPNKQGVLLFGGMGSGTTLLNDTWLWDGRDWTQLAVGQHLAGAGPSPRHWARMATDPLRGRVVMFGGCLVPAAAGSTAGDTWEWDGQTWIPCIPRTHQPTSRLWHSMSWNPSTRRVAMFGGTNGTTGSLSFLSIEEWDGQDWTQLTAVVSGSPVPGFMDAAAVPDPQGQGVLLFGTRYANAFGQTPTPMEGIWDGVRLNVQIPISPPPSRRMSEAVLLDTYRKEVVLFGGVTLSQSAPRDTWSRPTSGGTWSVAKAYPGPGFGNHFVTQGHVPWLDAWLVQVGADGSVWLRSEEGYVIGAPSLTLSGSPIWVTNLLVDSVHGRIFAYYFQLGMVFELTAAGWTRIPESAHGIPPSALISDFDPATGAFYHIGGSGPNASGLFRWNGGYTTQVAPLPPILAWGDERLVYDSDRQVAVLIKRSSTGVTVYEWNGQSWTSSSAALGFIRPYNGWDAEWMKGVGTVLVTASPDAVWRWDGAVWSRLNPRSTMPADSIQGLCLDRGRNRMRINTLDDALVFDSYWDLLQEQLEVDDPTPFPGTTLHFTVGSSPHAGQPWLLLLSRTMFPGVPLAGVSQDPDRILPLAADDLLLASLATGLRGVLDAQGSGATTLSIPADPVFVGFEFHAAALSITPAVQLGLISAPVVVRVTR